MRVVFYEHVQRGKLLWLAFAFILIEGTVLAAAGSEMPGIAVVIVLLVVIVVVAVIVTASKLTVTVAADDIVLWFGAGWPRKRISRDQIVAHRVTRNHWILGWGIRWFPGGTMWNVWGRDAIELDLASGRRLRIGTDDVAGLTAALSDR